MENQVKHPDTYAALNELETNRYDAETDERQKAISDWADKVLSGEINLDIEMEDSANATNKASENNTQSDQTKTGSDICDETEKEPGSHELVNPSQRNLVDGQTTLPDIIYIINEDGKGESVQNDDSTSQNSPSMGFVRHRSDNCSAEQWHEIDLNSDTDDDNTSISLTVPTTSDGRDGEGVQDEPNHAENDRQYVPILRDYVNKMYAICILPRNVEGQSTTLRLAFFYVVTLLAIYHSLSVVKFYILFGGMNDNILLFIVTLGFLVNHTALQMCFLYTIFNETSNFYGLLAFQLQYFSYKSGWITIASYISVLTSIIVGIGYPIIVTSIALEDYDIEDFVLYRALRFLKTLLIWDKDNYINDSKMLFNSYSNITAFTVCLGATDIFITTIGYIQQNLVNDTGLIVAFAMHLLTLEFKNELNENIRDTPPWNYAKIWTEYKCLCKFSKQLNNCLDKFLQLLHLHNLLFCSYFLIDHIVLGQNYQLSILQLLIVMKITCFYIISSSCATTNSQFRDWVLVKFRNPETAFTENSQLVSTLVLLEELSLNPIGLGNSVFFIDGSFIYKFASVVGSYFVWFYAQTTQ